MKFLKYFAFFVLGLIVLVLLAALFIPQDYKIERSVVIQAPQPVVMEQVRNLKVMNEWSPWVEQDPDMEITYGGNEGDIGSTSSWKSESMGTGTQTITKVGADRVETKLEMIDPWESSSDIVFQATPKGGATKATWSMAGKHSYPMNIMVPFLDGMVGKDYEKGLENLKKRCESQGNRVAS